MGDQLVVRSDEVEAADRFLQAVGYVGAPLARYASDMRADVPAMAYLLGRSAHGSALPITVVLAGAAGVGKTVASAFWLLGLAKAYKVDFRRDPGSVAWMAQRCAFAKAYALGRMNLRFVDADRVAFAKLKQVRFLVLDDLGAEDACSVGLVEELVDHRHGLGVQTVITTNLGCHRPDMATSPFAVRYGARTMGRLLESGRFEKCGTENLRPSGRAEVAP